MLSRVVQDNFILFHCTVPDNDCSIGSEIDNTTAIVSGILSSLLLLIVTITVIIIVAVILLRHRNNIRTIKRYIHVHSTCKHMILYQKTMLNNNVAMRTPLNCKQL